MHCKFHVSVELVPKSEHVPSFVNTGSDEGVDRRVRERVVFHCPVSGCPIVAVDYDPDKQTPKLCRICRKKTAATTSSMCAECGRTYRATLPEPKRKRSWVRTADPHTPRLPVARP